MEDLAEQWLMDIDPDQFGYLLGPQDQVIYNQINYGVPPWEVGRHASWPGFIGTSKMIQPVGVVNACHPRQAAQDAFDLGRIKDMRGVRGNYALEVCAGIAAGVAEALRPAASVTTVIDTVLSCLPQEALREVEEGLACARRADSWKDLRPLYADKYRGRPGSNAVEVLSGGLACFYVADGQPKEAILYAVNLGRDTDCKAYVSGGLAGALRGIDAIPEAWVQTVDKVAKNDPHTVSDRTVRETVEGLYRACLNEAERMTSVISEIGQADA